jgi:hypothetical protein
VGKKWFVNCLYKDQNEEDHNMRFGKCYQLVLLQIFLHNGIERPYIKEGNTPSMREGSFQKHSLTADKGWSSVLIIWFAANNPHNRRQQVNKLSRFVL